MSMSGGLGQCTAESGTWCDGGGRRRARQHGVMFQQDTWRCAWAPSAGDLWCAPRTWTTPSWRSYWLGRRKSTDSLTCRVLWPFPATKGFSKRWSGLFHGPSLATRPGSRTSTATWPTTPSLDRYSPTTSFGSCWCWTAPQHGLLLGVHPLSFSPHLPCVGNTHMLLLYVFPSNKLDSILRCFAIFALHTTAVGCCHAMQCSGDWEHSLRRWLKGGIRVHRVVPGFESDSSL